jgi:DNA-binding MarR family transcriptional regulator
MKSSEYECLVVYFLRKLAQLLYSHSRQMVRRCGLTWPQAVTLQTLLRDGETSVSALARKVSVSSGTMSGVLDRLEAKGLVERTRTPTDRRSVIVRYTGNAAAWFGGDLSLLNAEFSQRLAALSGEEKESILNALHQLTGMLGDPSWPSSIPSSLKKLDHSGIPLEELVIPNKTDSRWTGRK